MIKYVVLRYLLLSNFSKNLSGERDTVGIGDVFVSAVEVVEVVLTLVAIPEILNLSLAQS